MARRGALSIYSIGTLYNLCHGSSEHKLHLCQVLTLYGTRAQKVLEWFSAQRREPSQQNNKLYCTLLVMILGPRNFMLPSSGRDTTIWQLGKQVRRQAQ